MDHEMSNIEQSQTTITARTMPIGSVATFSHLSYEVKGKEGVKRLVDDVSVQVAQGEMFAIMGPS